MSRNLDVAYQCRVAPNAQRIVGEAAGADDLPIVRTPTEACDLGSGINAVHTGSGSGIPEVDVAIIRTTTSSEKVVLPWAPAKSFDGSFVVSLLEFGSI